jgi:hypothetical protein
MALLWEGRRSTALQCWREGRCEALQCSTAHPVSEDSTTSIDTIGFTTSIVSLLSATSVFPSLPRFRSIIRIHTLIPIPPAMGIQTALTAHTDMAQVMVDMEWESVVVQLQRRLASAGYYSGARRRDHQGADYNNGSGVTKDYRS